MLSEEGETTDELFAYPAVKSSLENVLPYLEIIYFTDNSSKDLANQTLFVCFNMGSDEINDKICDFVHELVDHLGRIKVSANKGKDYKKRRQAFEKKRQKEIANSEENKSRIQEKKERQKQTLTKEQLQKLEEKEAKKQSNKGIKVIKK